MRLGPQWWALPDAEVAVRTYRYICVGGPLDGELHDSESSMFMAGEVTYTASSLGGVWIWRPVEQSLTKTIEMLLDRYKMGCR